MSAVNPSVVDIGIRDHIATLSFQHPQEAPGQPPYADGIYMVGSTVDALYQAFKAVEKRDDVRVIMLANPTSDVFITHYSLHEIMRVIKPTLPIAKLLGRVFPSTIKPIMAFSRLLIKADRWAWLSRGIHAIARNTPLEGGLIYARANRLITDIRRSPKPLIAAISGNAQGYGMELSLACDFRLMAQQSDQQTDNNGYHLGQIESLIGLIPGSGGMHHLRRLVGHAKALELSMLGTRLNAQQAEQLGLIYKASQADELDQDCQTLASKLARKSPLALGYIKQNLRRSQQLPFEKALKLDEVGFMDTACSEPFNAAKQWVDADLQQTANVNQTFSHLEQHDLNPKLSAGLKQD